MRINCKMKIVPEELPNADGEWVWIPQELLPDADALMTGAKKTEAISEYIPDGYFVVAVNASWP